MRNECKVNNLFYIADDVDTVAKSSRAIFYEIVFLFYFIYLFKSDHSGSITHTIRTMNTHKHTQTIKYVKQKHTHYDEILNYSDAEQLITFTSLFWQEHSLLANVTFALYITVLQLGSPNSTCINMALTLLYL